MIAGIGVKGWLPNWSGISVQVILPEEFVDLILINNLTAHDIQNYYRKLKAGELDPDKEPYAFFKIQDSAGKTIKDFPDPNFLTIHVRYSEDAWNKIIVGGETHPIVYFLEKEKNDWRNDWVPFVNEENARIRLVAPGKGNDPYGHVYIEVNSLPDPNIGGPGD